MLQIVLNKINIKPLIWIRTKPWTGTCNRKHAGRKSVCRPAVADPVQQEHHLHPQQHRPRTSPLLQRTRPPRRWWGRATHPGKAAWWEWHHFWPHFLRCPLAGSGPHRWDVAQTRPVCPSPSAPPAKPEPDHRVSVRSHWIQLYWFDSFFWFHWQRRVQIWNPPWFYSHMFSYSLWAKLTGASHRKLWKQLWTVNDILQ